MTQIVINTNYSGFWLSLKAAEMIAKLKRVIDNDRWYEEVNDIARDDEDLVNVVKVLGEEANGNSCHLKIVTIPDDVDWDIESYDGIEWVAEVHRTWR